MKRFLPFALIIAGILVIIVGFVYDVLFPGIPYQDPTSALMARYEFHSRIASITRWSGLGIFVIGGLLGIIQRLSRTGRIQRDR